MLLYHKGLKIFLNKWDYIHVGYLINSPLREAQSQGVAIKG